MLRRVNEVLNKPEKDVELGNASEVEYLLKYSMKIVIVYKNSFNILFII